MIKIGKNNIKITNVQKELGNSQIDFTLSGPDIDYIVANTIRRTIFADIPIYAFNEFKFDKNTSVFHNNYLKLRLRYMPVWGIENTVEYLDINAKKIKQNNTEDNQDVITNDGDEVQLQADTTLNSSTLKQFTMYLNFKNKTNDIVTVTTNDAKFYYGEKQINSPYPVPIPIVKLQGNQEIAFSAISTLGIENEDAMYSAVNVAYYKQQNDNEFNFTIESKGQITEHRIMKVALINIDKKLKNFIKILNENKSNDYQQEGVIIVHNEDHTLGNLISRGLQKHSKISFAGYNLPHPLSKKVHIHYKLKDKSNIIDVIKSVVDYYNELFSQLDVF